MTTKRVKRAPPATAIYATSEARANFAALLAASADGQLIAFERFGQTVATLAPVEAIKILAETDVPAATRRKLRMAARELLASMPHDTSAAPVKAQRKSAPKRKTLKR